MKNCATQSHRPSSSRRRCSAELITLALEEQEWDALTSTPESQTYLARLSREIDEQEAAGEVEEGGWDP